MKMYDRGSDEEDMGIEGTSSSFNNLKVVTEETEANPMTMKIMKNPVKMTEMTKTKSNYDDFEGFAFLQKDVLYSMQDKWTYQEVGYYCTFSPWSMCSPIQNCLLTFKRQNRH